MNYQLYNSSFQRNLRSFLIGILLICFYAVPNILFAAGACSPYIGQATLNEFFKDQANQSNDPDDFAEVKILNSTIPLSTYGNWKIKICERSTAASNNDEDGCSTSISLSTFTNTTIPWLVLKGAGQPTELGQYINLKTGFDATLVDDNDDLIDYISVDGYTAAYTGFTCALSNLLYDYTASSPGASDKTIFRSPDGTGVWDSAPSATAPPTEDSTNDPLPPPPSGETYPYVTINDVSLSTPGTALFTISLTNATGTLKTFSQAVSVTYYTQDGTATAADNDYTAVPIGSPQTATIAAGQSTTTITINSPNSTDADAGEYFYVVLQAVQNSAANGGKPNASISKHYGTATLNGPVAEWNFDVCTISAPFDIKDTSGNNLHASPINGVATASGKVCSALSLDGINDYAEIADNANLDISDKLTVMAWIRPDRIPSSGLMTILSKDENYEFHINSAGNINWWWNNSSGATREFNSSVTVPINVWTHVAIVYEPGNQRIIINGVESGTRTYNETLRTNNDPLHIGGDQLFAGRYFDGLIDEVKVYRRALSTAEINSYYNNPNPGNRVCPTCVTPTCDTFRDEFSTQSYSRQDGTVNWTTNWIESGDNNNPSNGDVEINSGELQLEGDGASPSIEREANLAGYDNATLTFNYRTSGNWESSDNLRIYFSNNGGTSWTLQDTISNDQPSNTYSASIAAANLTSNFRIRFVEGANQASEIFHIDNVQINACKTSALHHLRITHDGTALTCQPESVTVTACANAACTAPHYTSNVVVTLTPSGWVGGDTQTITSGSSTFQLRKSTTGVVALGASSTNPVTSDTPSPSVSCLNTATSSTSCNIEFFDSGFIYTVPTQTSCATSNSITVQAVRLDATTQTCAPAFQNVSRNLKVWAAYSNPIPASITGTPAVTLVNGNGTYTLPATEPGTANVNMSFAASADETFTVNYPDAGQLTLNMKYEGSATNSDTGLTMLGANTYVTKPHSYFLQAVYDNAGTEVALNNATTSGAPSWKASDNFRLRLRGQCQSGTVTQNYTPTNAQMFVELTQPATGGTQHNLTIDGTNFISSYSGSPTWHDISGKFTSGSITSAANNYANAAFHEVGVLNLHVRDTQYITAGITIPEQTLTVGRFTPHHFDTTLIHGCDSTATDFTYSGQPFSVTATARNNVTPTPEITRNYTGALAKNTDFSNAGVTTNFVTGTYNLLATDFTNGIGNRTDVTYTFPAKDTPQATITLRSIDADGISSNGYIEETTLIRSGRARLENVYGSELTSLNMIFRTEYYSDNGTASTADDGFILNTDDDNGATCTTYDATAGLLSNYTGNLNSGETTVTGISPSPVSSGTSYIGFSASGAGNEGSVILLANNISSWLTYSWNIDCDNADGDNDITTGVDAGLCGPYGIASFGLFRGDDRIIYQREVF